MPELEVASQNVYTAEYQPSVPTATVRALRREIMSSSYKIFNYVWIICPQNVV